MKNLYKIFIFLVILIVNTQNSNAQINCGADQMHQNLLKDNPEYAKQIQQQLQKWKTFKETPAVSGIGNSPQGKIYEIPIVFHIIHTGQALGTAYNPTDKTIQNLVAYLN